MEEMGGEGYIRYWVTRTHEKNKRGAKASVIKTMEEFIEKQLTIDKDSVK